MSTLLCSFKSYLAAFSRRVANRSTLLSFCIQIPERCGQKKDASRSSITGFMRPDNENSNHGNRFCHRPFQLKRTFYSMSLLPDLLWWHGYKRGFSLFLGSLGLPYCGDVSNWPRAFDGPKKNIVPAANFVYHVTFCLHIVFL